MKASGFWSWWNHFGNVPLETCVDRAKRLNGGVIVKWGFWDAFNAFKQAGVPVAIERYVYPTQPLLEASRLADGINRGAEFAVINAEVEWETQPARPMEELIARFRSFHPDIELYAAVDTRGTRTSLPYQRVLGQHIAAWMSMVYPRAFRPHMPAHMVSAAFRDCFDMGQNFYGKPHVPIIQTYDRIGAAAVVEQLDQVARRGFPGVSAYTVCHALAQEWSAFVAGQGGGNEVTEEEFQVLQEKVNALHLRLRLSGMVLQWAGYGIAGQDAPEETLRQLHNLLHVAEQED